MQYILYIQLSPSTPGLGGCRFGKSPEISSPYYLYPFTFTAAKISWYYLVNASSDDPLSLPSHHHRILFLLSKLSIYTHADTPRYSLSLSLSPHPLSSDCPSAGVRREDLEPKIFAWNTKRANSLYIPGHRYQPPSAPLPPFPRQSIQPHPRHRHRPNEV